MHTTPNALMMFAAGFGTRMGALTKSQPKPMISVAGRPLIDHALDLARTAKIERIVANTHYLPQQLEAHLGARNVQVSRETPEILETGGGLRHALPLLGTGPVMTLNTDAVWTGANPLAALQAAWDPERMDALLMLVPRDHAVGHKGSGDFVMAPTGALTRGPGHVYSGAQIIKTDGLAAIRETAFSLNLLWNDMLPAGRVFGILHTGGWCDVGSPDGIQDAEALLKGTPDV